MLFNSLDFCAFIAVIWFIFRWLPNVYWRKWWILAASLFFYAFWNWPYVFLLLFTSSIDFWAAKFVFLSKTKKAAKGWLIASISGNLLVLGYFKYGLFLSENLIGWGFLQNQPDWLAVVLPLGISFYTFQAMAYMIDVYRNRLEPEKSYFHFLLFISFFPQLVAGPIERASHLIGQLRELKPIDSNKIIGALSLIFWGFWKKLFLADRLGVFVDAAFQHPNESNSLQIITATLFFGFQIYCDFSGYSDIARGVARFFGVELMLNFNRPYLANSLRDFWQKWHISLSGWFRDYVYFPLGGSRLNAGQTAVNLLVVFALSGLWHGANWTFLIWGLWHGLGLVSERYLFGQFKSNFLHRFLTLFWIFAGWTIFRANQLSDLKLFTTKEFSFQDINFQSFNLFNSNSEFLLACLGIGTLLLIERNWDKLNRRIWQKISSVNQLQLLGLGILILLWFGKFKGQDFIYFQF